MITALTVHGTTAEILWGYKPAAVVRTWSIARLGDEGDPRWTLTATLTRADAFGLRQRGLLFTAPRPGGFWCWAVESVDVVDHRLIARLGPPEQ